MKAEFKELGDTLKLLGGPAYPVYVEVQCDDGARVTNTYPGMFLRDYFAGQALAGLLVDPNQGAGKGESLQQFQARTARACFEYADAMLAERAKR